nr:MAG TPA: hypothetical protein [Caudoviricetes sp.]
MENKIVITQEIVKNATDYIPLMKKQEMAETIAQKCIVKVLMKYTEKGDGTDSVPMPDRYQEYHMYTNLYLMGVLAHEYLHIPYEGDGTGKEIIDYENLKMPANVYDQWGASHVLNQLEQMKTDREMREKVFDLLNDFKDFRWMLAHEIDILLGHNNDVVTRMMQALGASIKEMTADSMQELGEALQNEQPHEAEPEKKVSAEDIAKAASELERLKQLRERMEQVEKELHDKIEEAKAKNGHAEPVKEGLHLVE